jgi:hypothetical protein
MMLGGQVLEGTSPFGSSDCPKSTTQRHARPRSTSRLRSGLVEVGYPVRVDLEELLDQGLEGDGEEGPLLGCALRAGGPYYALLWDRSIRSRNPHPRPSESAAMAN